MTANACSSYGDIEQATLSECALKHTGFTEGEKWQRCASKAMCHVHCDALIRVFFRGREYQCRNFSSQPNNSTHCSQRLHGIGKQHQAQLAYDRVERLCVEINILGVHDARLD